MASVDGAEAVMSPETRTLPSVLSPAEIEQFRSRGFVCLESAFSPELAVAMQDVIWNELQPGPELADVEKLRDDGRGHVVGASYSSDTPTSGAHDSRAPRCGVYSTPLEPSLAVHALEHGAVVLWYQIDSPELAVDLAEVADEWDSHVIITSSTTLDEPIVATAWNRRKTYTEVTTDLADFIDTYRRRGPEQVSCDQT